MSTKEINTAMLKIIGMPFEVWLQYGRLPSEGKQKVVVKAIKKLAPDYCDVCDCAPCDCGYGS
jgi:hypothetical protein